MSERRISTQQTDAVNALTVEMQGVEQLKMPESVLKWQEKHSDLGLPQVDVDGMAALQAEANMILQEFTASWARDAESMTKEVSSLITEDLETRREEFLTDKSLMDKLLFRQPEKSVRLAVFCKEVNSQLKQWVLVSSKFPVHTMAREAATKVASQGISICRYIYLVEQIVELRKVKVAEQLKTGCEAVRKDVSQLIQTIVSE